MYAFFKKNSNPTTQIFFNLSPSPNNFWHELSRSDLEQVAIILIIHLSFFFFSLSSFLLFYQKGRC